MIGYDWSSLGERDQLLDCVRCGQPAEWLLYKHDPPDDPQYSDCWWYCDECRQVTIRDMVRTGRVPEESNETRQ